MKRSWLAALIGFGVLLVMGFVAVVALRIGNERPSSNEPCALQAQAAVIDRNAPVFQAIGTTNTDVIAIRNRDSAAWTGVVLAVYGFETTGTNGRRVTGRFEHRADDVEAGGLLAASLTDFQKPDGRRWTSVTMKADELEIRAKLHGQPCTATVSLNSAP
jgi:hypothetical protein